MPSLFSNNTFFQFIKNKFLLVAAILILALVTLTLTTSCSGKNDSVNKFTHNFITNNILNKNSTMQISSDDPMCKYTVNGSVCTDIQQNIVNKSYNQWANFKEVDWQATSQKSDDGTTSFIVIIAKNDNNSLKSFTFNATVIKNSNILIQDIKFSTPTFINNNPLSNWL